MCVSVFISKKKKNYKRGQWLPYEHENIENDLNEWKKNGDNMQEYSINLENELVMLMS